VTSGKVATTLGYERRNNPALRFTDRDAFVAFMTADQPARPANIANIVAINQGHRLLTRGQPVAPALGPAEVAARAAAGHLVIDTRRSPQFGAGHLAGAINVHLSSPEFEQRVGWVAPPEAPLVLVLDEDGEAPRAMKALAFVGLDARVSGFLSGGVEAWVASGRALETLGQIDVHQLQARLARDSGLRVLDVRERHEWLTGHIAGSRQLSYKHLAAEADTARVPPATTLAVICQGGSRSSTASSLLRRAGVSGLVNVEGGMTAWMAAGLPVETGAQCAPGPGA
jgi:hydroxyacylglutathione hydrolase